MSTQQSLALTEDDLVQLGKTIIDAMATELVLPLRQRVKVLEEQLHAIEAKGIAFEGVYASGRVYRRGSVVVRKGSSFVALEPTAQDPADATPTDKSWALLAARGRDGTKGDPGKDAR